MTQRCVRGEPVVFLDRDIHDLDGLGDHPLHVLLALGREVLCHEHLAHHLTREGVDRVDRPLVVGLLPEVRKWAPRFGHTASDGRPQSASVECAHQVGHTERGRVGVARSSRMRGNWSQNDVQVAVLGLAVQLAREKVEKFVVDGFGAVAVQPRPGAPILDTTSDCKHQPASG